MKTIGRFEGLRFTPESFGVYRKLSRRVGDSAATTYTWLRSHGQSATFSMRVMREQLAQLGPDYQGGLECVPFRKRRES